MMELRFIKRALYRRTSDGKVEEKVTRTLQFREKLTSPQSWTNFWEDVPEVDEELANDD